VEKKHLANSICGYLIAGKANLRGRNELVDFLKELRVARFFLYPDFPF